MPASCASYWGCWTSRRKVRIFALIYWRLTPQHDPRFWICACMCIRVHVCVYVREQLCVCACKCMCVSACVKVCVYMCVRACVYMCAWVYVCVRACVRARVSVCTYLHTLPVPPPTLTIVHILHTSQSDSHQQIMQDHAHTLLIHIMMHISHKNHALCVCVCVCACACACARVCVHSLGISGDPSTASLKSRFRGDGLRYVLQMRAHRSFSVCTLN